MLTHRLQDSAHLFTLPLGSDVGSNPFLQELQASLVFRNTQQFHGPFFIRRESNNFSDQITNKLIVVGLLALVVWRFLLSFNGGGLVTFVETSANFVFGRHAEERTNNVVNYYCLKHYYHEHKSVCGAFEKLDVHCKCLQRFTGVRIFFCNI